MEHVQHVPLLFELEGTTGQHMFAPPQFLAVKKISFIQMRILLYISYCVACQKASQLQARDS